MKKVSGVLFFVFLSHVSLYTPFFGLFLESVKKFNNNEIVFLFSIYSFAILVFEIPLGFLADKIGVKKVLILGSFALLLSTTLITVGSYYVVIFGEVLFAFSMACFSGADITLLIENNGSMDNEFDKLMGKYTSASWGGVLFGFLLGSLVALFDFKLCFVLTIVIHLFLFIFSFFLVDSKHGDKSSNIGLLKLIKIELVKNRELSFWLWVYASISCTLIVGYQLVQPLLNETKNNSFGNGLLYVIFTISALLSSLSYEKIISLFQNRKNAIIFSSLLIFLCFISIFFTSKYINYPLLIIIFSVFRFVWGFVSVVIEERLNFNCKENNIRVSINSVASLLSNLLSAISLGLIAFLNLSSKYSYMILSLLIISLILFITFHKSKSYE